MYAVLFCLELIIIQGKIQIFIMDMKMHLHMQKVLQMEKLAR